jgi:hypothetical protein
VPLALLPGEVAKLTIELARRIVDASRALIRPFARGNNG